MKQKLKELEEEAVKLRNTQVSSSPCFIERACTLMQPASSEGGAPALSPAGAQLQLHVPECSA